MRTMPTISRRHVSSGAPTRALLLCIAMRLLTIIVSAICIMASSAHAEDLIVLGRLRAIEEDLPSDIHKLVLVRENLYGIGNFNDKRIPRRYVTFFCKRVDRYCSQGHGELPPSADPRRALASNRHWFFGIKV